MGERGHWPKRVQQKQLPAEGVRFALSYGPDSPTAQGRWGLEQSRDTLLSTLAPFKVALYS